MATQELTIEVEEKGGLAVYRSPHFTYHFYITRVLTDTERLHNDHLAKRFALNRKAIYDLCTTLQKRTADGISDQDRHTQHMGSWQHHLAALSQKTVALYKEHREIAREIWEGPISWEYIPRYGSKIDIDEDREILYDIATSKTGRLIGVALRNTSSAN